jgi:VCBS repeat-containing protein
MANSVPTLTGLTTPVTFLENTVNGAPQIIAADVTFTDADNNFDTGTLTVADLLAQDTVAIRNQGGGAGEIGVAGSNVSFGGTVIGSFAGGAGSTLTVTFNAAATAAAIEALIENLTYANSSDTPTANRSLELKVTDAAGFAAIAPLAFTQQAGAANPLNGIDFQYRSTPSFADLDGDGDFDAIVGDNNGTLHYFQNTGSATAPVFTERTGAANPLNGGVGYYSAPSFADLDGDGDLDALVGDLDGILHYFQNTSTATAPAFTERTGAANPFDGVDVGFLAMPSFADIDGDGDLDAVVGAQDGTLRYFENTGTAIAPAFTLRTGAANPFNGVDVGNDSAPVFADLDGDGDLDLVSGEVFGTLRYFANTTPHQPAPDFVEQTGAANPFNGVVVGGVSKPSFADLDGDGDFDALVGEDNGTLNYFENIGSAIAPAFTERTGTDNPFNGVDVFEDSAPSFADLDGDGDLDAVIGERYGILHYFQNTGTATAPAFTEHTGAANPFNGVDVGDFSKPSFGDLDGDGDLDALVGVPNGTLHYFENTGSAVAPAFTERTGIANPFNGVDVGGYSTPSFADLDVDGDLDVIVGDADQGTLHYFENTGSALAPAFTERTGPANPFNGVVVGRDPAPSFGDLDGDGDLDAVVGEGNGTLHYFKNTGAGFVQVVNVTAQDDAATLSADVRNLTETNAAADISASGALTITDPDSLTTFVAQAGTIGLYGTFAIDSAGAWTYGASSAHNEFAAGSTHTDTFSVASSDGTLTSVTINIAGSNDTPVANAQSFGTDKDTAVPVTLSGSDVDGDSLAFTVLSGPVHGTLSGSGANRTYTPDPGYLGPDSFSYVANDGTLDSAAATVSLNVHLNIAPVVTAFDQSAVRGQVFNASDLFSANDGDGDALLYFFWDNNADPMSGYFTVNGVVQAANTTFAVDATQLAQTTFTAGQLPDDLFVNAWDFSLFSGPKEFHVNVPANQAPTVTAPDFSASKGQVISASTLFTANDANGDPLLYFFYDNSADPASGHFTVNGVVQAAGTTFAVTAAQLATTTFTAGTAVSDGLFVNAWDGSAFSGPKEFHVSVPANQAPTVTASNQTVTSGQVLNASSLFSANDADGDSLLYFFYDNSAAPTSGHFDVNGAVQAASTTFAVTQAQLANTTFVVGTTGDDLFVNVWDGVAFSGPKEFSVDIV